MELTEEKSMRCARNSFQVLAVFMFLSGAAAWGDGLRGRGHYDSFHTAA